jgi:hypothetical protein
MGELYDNCDHYENSVFIKVKDWPISVYLWSDIGKILTCLDKSGLLESTSYLKEKNTFVPLKKGEKNN